MRRIITTAAAFGVFAAGLGCKHVGGMCDCLHDPANAEINTGHGGGAYPALGSPIPSGAVPEKMAAPVMEKPAAPAAK